MLAPAIARGTAFARDERGVTAVEFGILAIPFFTIIVAVLETAVMFLGSQVLDSALEDASRLVRTGQAQAGNWDSDRLRSYMCDYTFGLFDCSQILLRVKVIDDFNDVDINPIVQDCTPHPPQPTTCVWDPYPPPYQPGSSRQIVQVSAYYRWPIPIVLPYFNLKNQPDNYRLISAVRVFRNEPFTGAGS